MSWRRFVPDGGFAHDVVLHLEFLHLAFADGTVLALKELLLDLMPGADVFLLECNLYSGDARSVINCGGIYWGTGCGGRWRR